MRQENAEPADEKLLAPANCRVRKLALLGAIVWFSLVQPQKVAAADGPGEYLDSIIAKAGYVPQEDAERFSEILASQMNAGDVVVRFDDMSPARKQRLFDQLALAVDRYPKDAFFQTPLQRKSRAVQFETAVAEFFYFPVFEADDPLAVSEQIDALAQVSRDFASERCPSLEGTPALDAVEEAVRSTLCATLDNDMDPTLKTAIPAERLAAVLESAKAKMQAVRTPGIFVDQWRTQRLEDLDSAAAAEFLDKNAADVADTLAESFRPAIDLLLQASGEYAMESGRFSADELQYPLIELWGSDRMETMSAVVLEAVAERTALQKEWQEKKAAEAQVRRLVGDDSPLAPEAAADLGFELLEMSAAEVEPDVTAVGPAGDEKAQAPSPAQPASVPSEAAVPPDVNQRGGGGSRWVTIVMAAALLILLAAVIVRRATRA